MHYGQVLHRKGWWYVRCEPHVRARLKRMFPRAPQEAADVITISDSPENSRDLQWFLERYPMQVDKPERLKAAAGAHRLQEIKLSELLERRAPPMKIDLAEPPRDYQAVVPQYLDVKRGLLLADDVGLGKTVSGISCLQLPGALPAAIVVPPHLAKHWATFIRRFAPSLKVHVVNRGGGPEAFAAQRGPGPDLLPLPDVVVISYFRLRQWAEYLGQFVRTVIFEECQQLRNADSQIYIAAEYLARKVQRRLGLSATPIYNYGSEFFYVVDVLSPGAVGSRDEFVREWCKAQGGDKARLSDPEQFGAYLRREGIMLRRTRREVNRELPPVSKIIHEIEADAGVLEKLTGGAIELAQTILRANERYRGEHMRASAEFDNVLRQATGVAKAPYVAEFVRLLLENGERVVLFGWHRAVYGIWLERLKDFNPVMYTGSESLRQKSEAEEKFKAGGTNLFIMSLRSGAGVDGLQKVCRTAVFGELDWSPGVHEQCVGRVDRDGQPDPVTAYFLVSEDGADPIMTQVLGIKRQQIEGVRNPGGGLIERIDTGDNNMRQLARDFLTRRGIAVPKVPAPSSIREPA